MLMFPERQTTYGWLVATDIFLAGVGGGVFLISVVLELLGKYETIAKTGTLLGPVLVLLGTFFLIAELGRKTRFYKLFTNLSSPSSWLSRGTWILIAFVILGLAYSLPSFQLFSWLPWSKTSALGQGIGIAAGLFSVLVIIYPGFLFGVVKGIPFWNTPILPFVFLFSSLSTGVAAIMLVALLSGMNLEITAVHHLGAAGIVLILILLLALGVYLYITSHQGFAAMESLRLLKTPLFISGALIVGLVVPLAVLIYAVFVGDMLTISILTGVGSLCLLAGGLLLRYAIIRAGVYLSLR
ncbi:NrfD/PsrC family molybdoenzyme membrane anchor subunit [Chloroflexota bacterium]